jgi:poly(hydroxyalkanoate) depolymerase family esterase
MRRKPERVLAVVCVAVGMLAIGSQAAGAATLSPLPTATTPWLQYIPGLQVAKLPQMPTTQLPQLALTNWWTTLLPGGSPTTPTPTIPTSDTGDSTGNTFPTQTSTSLPGKAFTGTYYGGGGTMDYEAYVPSGYKSGTAVPLVVSMHGCSQTADVFRQQTRWDQLAEAKDFIVVFPQQSQSNNNLQCWDFFQNADMQRSGAEPSQIAGLTRWFQKNYSVDAHRTWVDGFSAGGGMTSVMAATYPDLYAAAGIESGCEYASTAACAGSQGIDPASAGQQAYSAMGSHARVMPVMLLQGDQDKTVPPVNASQIVQQWQVTDDLADDGARNGSVPSNPVSITQGQVPNGHSFTVTVYFDGQGKELLQYWLVNGMGHAWSGGCSCEPYSDPAGPDATGAMYAFFVKHPLP